MIASDLPYAINGPYPFDLGLDFAAGRIPVDVEQAQTVVDKIVQYESSPPFTLPGFFHSVAIASQFQCCRLDTAAGTDKRAFIAVVENVRDRLLANGYGVERIYTETVAQDYMGDPAPRFYYGGTSLPSALQPPFPWAGSTMDISDAMDDGRFLLIHLDHAGSFGWAHPQFNTNHANALTNGALLPVVLGFNCSSGLFDNETDGFPNEPMGSTDRPFSYPLPCSNTTLSLVGPEHLVPLTQLSRTCSCAIPAI